MERILNDRDRLNPIHCESANGISQMTKADEVKAAAHGPYLIWIDPPGGLFSSGSRGIEDFHLFPIARSIAYLCDRIFEVLEVLCWAETDLQTAGDPLDVAGGFRWQGSGHLVEKGFYTRLENRAVEDPEDLLTHVAGH